MAASQPSDRCTADALLVVDMQSDFMPGGALPVACGDRIVEPINAYMRSYSAQNRPIFATRDWHPADHCSFVEQGGPWPSHCVAGTAGAQFATTLQMPPETVVISKATSAESDAYSGFAGTDLEEQLRAASARRVAVCGLATDYCVLQTVRDALAKGFKVLVLEDAIAAVERNAGDGERAIAVMRAMGAEIRGEGDL
jgi:nicotinamidase/pyrazinamidase